MYNYYAKWIWFWYFHSCTSCILHDHTPDHLPFPFDSLPLGLFLFSRTYPVVFTSYLYIFWISRFFLYERQDATFIFLSLAYFVKHDYLQFHTFLFENLHNFIVLFSWLQCHCATALLNLLSLDDIRWFHNYYGLCCPKHIGLGISVVCWHRVLDYIPRTGVAGLPENVTFSVFEEVNASFTICPQSVVYC